MSIYGCPEQEINKWEHGYTNITYAYPNYLYEKNIGAVQQHHNLYTLGPFGRFSHQLNYCTKVTENGSSSSPGGSEWPRGSYAIYKGFLSHCPDGMITLFLFTGHTGNRSHKMLL